MTPERQNPEVGTSTRDVLRSADELLTARLERVGFVRLARGINECGTSSPEVLGWLGLNESVAEGVRLFPVVGVRVREVEAMLEPLGGSAYSGPLATVQLGYLMPARAAQSWAFHGELAVDEAAAADLVVNVQRFALPFFESNRALPAVADSVKSNADEDSRAYVLPVLQALDNELLADESDAGSMYRSFIARLFET
jgi:hypothetical protein